VREIAAEMLAHLGHDVETAVNGEKRSPASEKLSNRGVPSMRLYGPHRSGGMGGKTAVKILLDLDPKARVIVSSGYSADSLLAITPPMVSAG